MSPLLVVALLLGGAAAEQEQELGAWPGAGDGADFHWIEWEPWVCMCDIGKQGRIRYFVVSTNAENSNVSLDDFWQLKPCSHIDCMNCQHDECPMVAGGGASSPRFGHRFSRPAPDNLRAHNTKPAAADSYDSLPVIDDVG
ncbi:thrombospondin type-1 domain-containing protein 8-like [Leucoraja erinacea]|uniref:thrombospondin type-1 domain-containing protein 8-like n=1 Tax=Leucoraja erinaceus TaxID=7782 RepID=UPI0024546C85|nr:thrombospondin type-1 domain-containing protein 8-like [Leucoraja erinacea]